MYQNSSDSSNQVLKIEGKKYLINKLLKDIKESINGLQIAEIKIKLRKDT
tara:strand:- start:338 stop:487 length:150 start_codon:yes stop_codon:yes gene_type:complete